MPVASRQSAGLPMYRSYTGTLPAFTGAPPGHHRRQPGRCRSSAGVCIGPGGATVPPRLFPVPSRLFPVPRRSLPVLPGDPRFIPEVLNILILSRWSPGRPRFIPVVPGGAPVHPGRAPVHPGRSRITHRGSTGIIVRLGLKALSEILSCSSKKGKESNSELWNLCLSAYITENKRVKFQTIPCGSY